MSPPKDYDSTLARMAGNIAAGIAALYVKPGSTQEYLVTALSGRLGRNRGADH